MQQLSDQDKELLRDSATRFFNEQMPVSAMREIRDQQHPDGFSREMWAGMAGMGWSGILVAEQLGGLALGHASMGIIMEASGRTLAASPLLSTAVLGANLVQKLATPEQRDSLLEKIISGELLCALAIEEHRRHCPNAIATTAEETSDGFVLNGSKNFVLDGHVADRLIVLARTSGAHEDCSGLSLFIVDAKTSGITIERAHMVDGRNAAKIRFDNVVCANACLLGEKDNAFETLDQCLDFARAAISAEMLGSISEAFDRTIEYLKLRTQFDVPIGSFQALKHRAAEMFCEIELTRSAVLEAQNALDEAHESSARLVSLAKAKASSTFERVSNEALQMHGGIGMTDAEEIGLFLKRARVAQQIFGDYEFHRDRYARLSGF
ncbi:MAG: acyl-CoA dehydrogenase family protein [Pseudomonadota bacterium]